MCEKMSVYTFDKSFLQRLDDIKLILEEEDGSSVKNKFKDFIETSLEPAGYSAIWKLSRANCEDLNVKYPCEVYGIVQNTVFEDLCAFLSVEGVQDESVHLPEVCKVPLEDLYPTIEQENSALNVDLTADCLDRFRFFFKYIFFPWDTDEDQDFAGKLLQPRMRFFFDLKNKQISKGLSSHIRGMLAEAQYIQHKRENLENSFEESDEEIDISKGESKEKARKLLELYLRMMKIKHEVDILINPEMREIYEEVKFPHHRLGKTNERMVFAVTKAGILSEQIQTIQELKNKVTDETKIHWLSLHDAIAASGASSEIYIPAGVHSISFLEYLNGNVLLCGLSPISIETLDMEQLHRYAKVTADDSGSMLFVVDGDLQLQHLIIDCENVKTGFLVKDGKVTVKNCVIIGTKESSVTEAFTISGATKVLIENCVIMNFATGIVVNDTAKVNIRNSSIKNCNIGIQLLDNDAMMSMENASLINCDEYGILKYATLPDEVKSKALDWNGKEEAGSFHVYLLGDANKFDGNKKNIEIASKFAASIPIMTDADESMDL